jgi:hypothetical protein
MRLAKWPPWGPGENTTQQWSHNSYRPLVVMSFRADHYFFDKEVVGYHVTNVVVHVLACVAALFLLEGVLGRGRWLHSLAAASLFAVHPVHTEVVANITSRAETMCGVLVLAAGALYLRLVPVAPSPADGPPASQGDSGTTPSVGTASGATSGSGSGSGSSSSSSSSTAATTATASDGDGDSGVDGREGRQGGAGSRGPSGSVPTGGVWASVVACSLTATLIVVAALCKETALVMPVIIVGLDILCRSPAVHVESAPGTGPLGSAAAFVKACLLRCSWGRVTFWVVFQVVFLYARVALLSSGYVASLCGGWGVRSCAYQGANHSV